MAAFLLSQPAISERWDGWVPQTWTWPSSLPPSPQGRPFPGLCKPVVTSVNSLPSDSSHRASAHRYPGL